VSEASGTGEWTTCCRACEGESTAEGADALWGQMGA